MTKNQNLETDRRMAIIKDVRVICNVSLDAYYWCCENWSWRSGSWLRELTVQKLRFMMYRKTNPPTQPWNSSFTNQPSNLSGWPADLPTTESPSHPPTHYGRCTQTPYPSTQQPVRPAACPPDAICPPTHPTILLPTRTLSHKTNQRSTSQHVHTPNHSPSYPSIYLLSFNPINPNINPPTLLPTPPIHYLKIWDTFGLVTIRTFDPSDLWPFGLVTLRNTDL